MKTFQEFVAEAYDASVMSSSQIRRTGAGGRIGAERKKTAPERRRVKAVGGGQTAPAKPYKPRKDIGTQRPRSTREQQPTQERGSAALSPKEAQRKAYLERKAREKGATTQTASQLLAKKKKAEVSPKYKPQKASGLSRQERLKVTRQGEALTRDLVIAGERAKGKNIKSEKDLKHRYTSR